MTMPQDTTPQREIGPDLMLHNMSRNPSVEHYEAFYRGYKIPYIDIVKVPIGDDGEQAYPIDDSSDGPTIVHRWSGAFRWELSLDDRWAYDFDTEDELRSVLPMLADGMAVAAGFACHGVANRLNPHGPVMVYIDAPAEPGTVELRNVI